MAEKTDIKCLSMEELTQQLKEIGCPNFRSKQIWQWLYPKFAKSFEDMSNLPKQLRADLSERFTLNIPEIALKQQSCDGTTKYLLRFNDGICVETVGIPSHDGKRLTVCVSSQAGCAMGCTFCATGHGGFKRQLSQNEIISQIQIVGADFNSRVSNVVVMGQGEPFANYDNLISALKIINDKGGLEIGARHITVSTCGILKGIERFGDEPEQFTLAISLHAAIQQTRDEIMPGVAHHPLPSLKRTIEEYINKTGRRPTFEYAMIKGVNDSKEDLDALLSFCDGLLCHVNLIPLNPISSNSTEGWMMEPSGNTDFFLTRLNRNGIEASLRSSRGGDIDGACGQLSQKAASIS